MRKEFLEDRKIKFLSAVEKCAKSKGVQVPKVKFWGDYSHFGNERAHIHTEINTICIAEPELEIMDYEDIEETASHEVSHLFNIGHGTDFEKTQDSIKIGTFQPPAGVIHIKPNKKVEEQEEVGIHKLTLFRLKEKGKSNKK